MFDEAKIRFNMPVRYDQEYKLWRKVYPREFFDRQQERNAIFSALEDLSSHQPIAIIGERRSGKTSMLRYLVEKHQKDFNTIHAPEYGIQNAIAFLQALWMDVAPEVPPLPDHVTHAWWQEQLIQRMEARVTKERKPILLWIDELDAMFENEKMSDEEKEKILGFFLELIERVDFPVKLVFSITYIPAIPHLRSLLMGDKAFRVSLGPLSRKAVEEMVQAMLEDGRSWGEVAPFWDWPRFCEETGCQPYYMKALLVHLGRVWRKHGGDMEKEAWWEQSIQHTLRDDTFTNHCVHIYKRYFDERERAVLLWMVRSEGELSFSALEEAGLENAARNLVKRFYLQEEKGRVTFRLGLLRRWLAAWADFKKE